MYGFHGKVLLIDVTDRSHRVEEIPEAVLRRYLGGRGLGSHLLWQGLRPGTDPLGPDNFLVFVTGSAADSAAPGCSRCGKSTHSPLTGAFLARTAS